MSGNTESIAAFPTMIGNHTASGPGLQARNIVHLLVLALFHRGHPGLSTRISLINFRTPAGIFEINLFGDAQLIENLNAQNGLFSVVETSASQSTSRLVRSVASALFAPQRWHCRSNP